jgi:hypothetical protein
MLALISCIKALTPFECKYQIVSGYPFGFRVDASEDLVMVDDVVTPSNPPVVSIKEEKLE